ncbi:hypothetical protein ACNTMW_24105 [Planosporangium sp. 12N6]
MLGFTATLGAGVQIVATLAGRVGFQVLPRRWVQGRRSRHPATTAPAARA